MDAIEAGNHVIVPQITLNIQDCHCIFIPSKSTK